MEPGPRQADHQLTVSTPARAEWRWPVLEPGPVAYLGAPELVDDTHPAVEFSLDKLPVGGTAGWTSHLIRRVANQGDYRAKVTGSRHGRGPHRPFTHRLKWARKPLLWPRPVVAGLSYAGGGQANRAGSGNWRTPTTLRAKVWRSGTTEPAAWQVTGHRLHCRLAVLPPASASIRT